MPVRRFIGSAVYRSLESLCTTYSFLVLHPRAKARTRIAISSPSYDFYDSMLISGVGERSQSTTPTPRGFPSNSGQTGANEEQRLTSGGHSPIAPVSLLCLRHRLMDHFLKGASTFTLTSLWRVTQRQGQIRPCRKR